jgi:hypothetical protein
MATIGTWFYTFPTTQFAAAFEESPEIGKTITDKRAFGSGTVRGLRAMIEDGWITPIDSEAPPTGAVVYDWEYSPAGADDYDALITADTPTVPSPSIPIGTYDFRYRPRFVLSGDDVEVEDWFVIEGVEVVATGTTGTTPVLILGDDSMKPMSAAGSAKERTLYFDAYDDDGVPVTTLTGKAQLSINGAASVASTNNIAAAPGGGTYSVQVAATELAAVNDVVRVRPFGDATRHRTGTTRRPCLER